MNDKLFLSITQKLLLKEMLLSEWCSFADNELIHMILRKGHYTISNREYLNDMRASYIEWLKLTKKLGYMK